MKKIFIISIFILSSFIISAGQEEGGFISIGFDDSRWSMDHAKKLQYKERDALMGSAMLSGVEFQNGIIKVDIFTSTKKRNYPGVLFRFISPTDYERVYIRPHRSGLYPDTIQYVPCFNGIDSWQLYNGDGFTSLAEIPSDTWFTLTVEVIGAQAKIFIADQAEPALIIKDLKHGERKGTIGLSGFLDNTAYFSNFRYKLYKDIPAAASSEPESIPGMIQNWELSIPFKDAEIRKTEYPRTDPAKLGWRKAVTGPDGLLDISKFIGPEVITGEPLCIFAKTYIRSDREQKKKFLFGYSDVVHIYLNGNLLFTGDSTYRSRDLSFLGVVGLFDAVFLDLKPGNNELLFVLTEQMGGWGLICRDADEIYQDKSLTLNWKIEDVFKIPESIAFDPKEKSIYVSNYDAYRRSFKEGLQSISKISSDGKIINLDWVKGLANPTGLVIYKDKLYAVERIGIAEIELSSGKILNRFPCKNSVMLNDITVSKDGILYISDSVSGSIFRVKDGAAEVLVSSPELRGANGLTTDDENIYVLTNGDGCLKQISISEKKISQIAELNSNTLDGLHLDEKGNFLFSKYDGRLYRMDRTGKAVKMLDLTGPETYIADFFYDKTNHLIIFPTLLNNSVRSYSLH